MDRHTIMYTNASLSIHYNLSNVSLSLVEKQFKEKEKDLRMQLHDRDTLLQRKMKELLTYKQKMTESTSNDDIDTSKGNYESTQSDTNEEEKGITILTIIIIIIV